MTPRERAARERARALFTIAPNDDGYTTVMLGEEVVEVAPHVDALVETLRLAAPIARAIESAIAERDAGEAERVREAVARERAAREKAEADAAALRAALGDFAERDCDYGDDCPPFGTRHGQCDGCRARVALARATSPAPAPVAADVDAALATIDEAIRCQFGLVIDGRTIKGYTPDRDEPGLTKCYLDADDCRALSAAFGVVADALAAARKGGG